MAQVLVRDLNPGTVVRLKERARRHGRSLQGEVKSILEREVRVDIVDAKALARRIQRSLVGRHHSDSAALLAEDRAR